MSKSDRKRPTRHAIVGALLDLAAVPSAYGLAVAARKLGLVDLGDDVTLSHELLVLACCGLAIAVRRIMSDMAVTDRARLLAGIR